ncbi:MAG: hypothetical protein J0M12_07780 [Deltaproteobacteria bacterium]|nr:hypothetical protein [Deltaproteobacteria bacterium]
MMMSERKSQLMKLLALVLRPAVRFCLRHSLRLQDFLECGKTVFIDESAAILREQDLKINTSRISLMTGVHRRDVARIREYGLQLHYEQDLITKTLGLWQTGERFLTKSRQPRTLSVEGPNPEFAALVLSVSKDMNPASVLFELQRIGAIEVSNGAARLTVQSYVPKGEPLKGFAILSNDAEDLTQTVEENVLRDPEVPQFHARTEYDNVRPEAIPELKRWFLKEGHEFHARVRDFVSKFDQDINPDPNFRGKGTKISFTAFSNVKEEQKQ